MHLVKVFSVGLIRNSLSNPKGYRLPLFLLFLLCGRVLATIPPPIPNTNLPITGSAASICPGDSADVIIANSEPNVKYQLREHITNIPIGPLLTGNGGNLALSTGPLFSSTAFNVLATDTIDATTLPMADTVLILVYDHPPLHPVPDSLEICAGINLNFQAHDHALEFDGINDYVRVNGSVGLTNATTITVEAWIYANAWEANVFDGVIVSKADVGPPTGTQGWILSTGNNGRASFEVAPIGPQAYWKAESGPVMNTGQWHHLAGTFDGNAVRIYIDGVLQSTQAYVGTIQPGTSDLYFGRHTLLPGRQFEGRIDEVRIWDVALTANQLQQRANRPLGGNEPGLLAVFNMEEGMGDSLTADAGPSSYVGALDSMDILAAWVPGVFNAPAATYNWQFGDGGNSGAPNPAHAYLFPGNYTVTLTTDDVNGCSFQDSVDVSITSGPPVDIGPDTSFCGTFNLVLDATTSTAASYLWSNGAVSAITTVNNLGTHYVTVTDLGGCITIDSLIISSATAAPIDLGPDDSICPGQSLLLDPGIGYSNHVWSTGATSPTLSVNAPGTYYLDALDSNGCASVDTIRISAGIPTTVLIAPLNPVYCGNDPAVALSGSPLGGTFSGAGVTGNTWDPAQTTPGPVQIIYQATAPNQCPGADTLNLIVAPVPVTSFSGLAPSYCVDGAAVTLAGLPLGGGFSGPGMNGLDFDPAIAGTGSHAITYSFTNAQGCTDSTTQTTTVNALPIVQITGLLPLYCENSAPVAIGGNPAGGIYAGTGVTGGTFDPLAAGVGIFVISYTYTDLNGCTAVDSFDVEVSQTPTAAFTGLAPAYCDNDGPVTLTGNPLGGVFSGPGISGNSFDPAATGGGANLEIVYLYQAGPNCSDADTQLVSINPAPSVELTAAEDRICEDAAPIQLIGTPPSGTFSGPGVTGNSFDPQASGPSNALTLFYQFTDANGCSNIDSTQIQVDQNPPPANAGPDVLLWLDDELVLNGNVPGLGSGLWTVESGGGSFSDPGIPSPTLSGIPPGTSLLRWTLTNGACSSSDGLTVERRPFEEARGFSPNEDGSNDKFVIEGLERYPGSKIQILSRWGDVVFESDDYQNDWAGSNQNGEVLPDDTYFFVLDVSNGKRFKGYVELRR